MRKGLIGSTSARARPQNLSHRSQYDPSTPSHKPVAGRRRFSPATGDPIAPRETITRTSANLRRCVEMPIVAKWHFTGRAESCDYIYIGHCYIDLYLPSFFFTALKPRHAHPDTPRRHRHRHKAYSCFPSPLRPHTAQNAPTARASERGAMH